MTLKENYIAYKTIFIREVLRFSRIWIQTLLPPTVVTALYLLIFGEVLGEKIGSVGGYPFIEFIVPGLILMTVIQNAYANVVSSFYSSKFQRNIEEILVSPTPHYVILCGFAAGGVARGVVVGMVVTLVTSFFVRLQIYSVLVLVTTLVLTSLLFSVAGFINAIYAKSFDDISIIPTFVLTPLTYLGGVFYKVEDLPLFWQGIAACNPILYMVNAFRFGFLHQPDVSLLLSYSILLGFIAVLWFYALFLLHRGTGLRT